METDIRQTQQESDPEISDGEEISGSDNEPTPAVRRTGGPKETEDWPMGPDYPPEPASAPTPVSCGLMEKECMKASSSYMIENSLLLFQRDTVNYDALEVQMEEVRNFAKNK